MASKRKGLSIEEKKQRLYELFLEKKEVFQLKELERIAPKEKGIVVQSVKDVLQMLVDDGLVESDKIGTLVCFWAFASKAASARKRKLDDTVTEIESLKVKKAELQKRLVDAGKGKDNSEERDKLIEKLAKAEAEHAELRVEYEKYKDYDPEKLENRRKEVVTAKSAANRWTDNIFSIKSWCRNKFQMDEGVINKQFSIPNDIDYIE